jgi:AGZA family xanthine/uracil permease-like MFS transporter
MQIKFSNPMLVAQETFSKLMVSVDKALPEMQVIVALGNGFILTAMLWGGFVAALIDRKLKQTTIYLLVLAVFTFFGIIHSAMPDGNMYLPWKLVGVPRQVPYQFALAYLILAATIFFLSFTKESKHTHK